jgi:F-type H+-transporting ATPase subunit b
MELVKPGLGLLFWMVLSFGFVLFILTKYAWKPIMQSLKEREDTIEGALNAAKKAKEEMAGLKSDNEKLLRDARMERDLILKEAREARESIMNEAKANASSEANRMIASARQTIENEKTAAVAELKNQVARISVEIAEKILRQELSGEEKQKRLMESLLRDTNLN